MVLLLLGLFALAGFVWDISFFFYNQYKVVIRKPLKQWHKDNITKTEFDKVSKLHQNPMEPAWKTI